MAIMFWEFKIGNQIGNFSYLSNSLSFTNLSIPTIAIKEQCPMASETRQYLSRGYYMPALLGTELGARGMVVNKRDNDLFSMELTVQ